MGECSGAFLLHPNPCVVVTVETWMVGPTSPPRVESRDHYAPLSAAHFAMNWVHNDERVPRVFAVHCSPI